MKRILVFTLLLLLTIEAWAAAPLDRMSVMESIKGGKTLLRQGAYPELVARMDSLLQQSLLQLSPQDTLIGEIRLELGLGLYLDGNPREALDQYEQAYQILLGQSHPQKTLDCLYRMGIACRETGDLFRGEDYLREAAKVAQQNFGVQDLQYAKVLNALGNHYIRMERFSESLQAFDELLPVFTKKFGGNSAQVAAILGNKGVALTDLGRFEEGETALIQALNIRLGLLPEHHPSIGTSYNNLGDLWLKAGQLGQAEEAYRHSLQIWSQSLTPDHYFLALNHRNLGEVKTVQGRYKEALIDFQESFKVLSPGFAPAALADNPPLQGCISQTEMLNTLEAKAEACQAMGRSTLALQCIEQAVDLIDLIRQGLRRENSRLNLAQRSRSIFERGLDLCHQMYNLNGSRMWMDKAFELIEKSRATLLLAAFRGEEAGRYAQIDPQLLHREIQLRKDAIALSQQLEDARQAGDSLPRIQNLQQAYFKCIHAYEAHLDSIQVRFPRYFQLKYRNEVLSLREAQDSLHGSETAFISFFMGEKQHFLLGISEGKAVFIKLKDPDQLSLQSREWASQLSQRQRDWQQNAHALYKGLLHEGLSQLNADSSIRHLVFLRDGNLEYLPFEALLTQPLSSGNSRNAAYLIRDYTISYALSATLHFGEMSPSQTEAKGYFALAPDFSGIDSESGSRNVQGQLLPDLPFAREEVEQGQRLLGGKAIVGARASEDLFRELAPGQEILHLATHTLVDDRDPLWSRLVLSQAVGGEDGFLHTYELLGLKLHAKLTILSACNTGTGGMQRGEGMMSLARGFAYAGCPSTVMTHWTVSDKTTSEIIKKTFQGLTEGKDFAEALQKAKLQFLENADEITAHPYFWAGISLIGQSGKVSTTGQKGNWLLLIGSLALVLFLKREWNN